MWPVVKLVTAWLVFGIANRRSELLLRTQFVQMLRLKQKNLDSEVHLNPFSPALLAKWMRSKSRSTRGERKKKDRAGSGGKNAAKTTPLSTPLSTPLFISAGEGRAISCATDGSQHIYALGGGIRSGMLCFQISSKLIETSLT